MKDKVPDTPTYDMDEQDEGSTDAENPEIELRPDGYYWRRSMVSRNLVLLPV